jgi:predicted small lipoprotein YifL
MRLYTDPIAASRTIMRRLSVLFWLALCACLASCGNKGPLVRPDQKPAQPQQPATQDSSKQP